MKREKVILVGTYHKTGTVWMKRVLRSMARRLDWPFFLVARDEEPSVSKGPLIALQDHSQFHANWYELPHVRGFRVIRDPRDIVISGAHYHLKSEESWLNVPNDIFGGLTYQQSILKCPTLRETFEFEMQHVAANTVSQMLGRAGRAFALSRRRLKSVRYEDLIMDDDDRTIIRLGRHLRLGQRQMNALVDSMHEHSIRRPDGLEADRHIRSGAVAQWRSVYDQPLARAFVGSYGPVLRALGYSWTNLWIRQLSPRNTELDEPRSTVRK